MEKTTNAHIEMLIEHLERLTGVDKETILKTLKDCFENNREIPVDFFNKNIKEIKICHHRH